MKHTRHILTAALLLSGAVTAAQAQTFILWTGDFRLGLTAGLGHHFEPFAVKVPAGYILDGDATTALLTPSIGLYSGMEKDLSRNLSFGFDAHVDYSRPATSFTLKNSGGTSFDYSFSASRIGVEEGLYFAYHLTDNLQGTLGAGIYGSILFGVTATDEPGGSAPSASTDDDSGFGVSMGFGLGAVVSAGVTYYFNDVFFVKGNIDMQTAPFFSSYDLDEEFGSGYGSSSNVRASVNSGVQLALTATIGFKW